MMLKNKIAVTSEVGSREPRLQSRDQTVITIFPFLPFPSRR